MSTDDSNSMLSTPNHLYVKFVAAALRAIVQAAAGFGVGWAAGVSGEEMMILAGTLVALGSLAWSWYEKWLSERAKIQAMRESAIQSAVATHNEGKPTVVTSISPSAPNVVAHDLNTEELRRIRSETRN